MFIAQNWGLIDYKLAWDKQKELTENLKNGDVSDYLVFCEHPAVITMGRNSKNENLLVSNEYLEKINIGLYEIDRGGDVTLHNEGQLIGYPIINLTRYKQDLHWYLRAIEQSIIDALKDYGLTAGRVDGYTGVWLDGARKICAIGVHCSRWITSHGFAFNINNDLSQFNLIVPCGISEKNKTVTSLSAELGAKIDIDDVRNRVEFHLKNNLSKI